MKRGDRGLNLKDKWGTGKKVLINAWRVTFSRRYDNKIIVAGTGRAGTTFLIQLLTRLGEDTGYEPYNEDFGEDIRAGCEYRLFINDMTKQKKNFAKAAKILKHPEYSYRLQKYLKEKVLGVEHIIIPVRDLRKAAKSRVEVGLLWEVPGINKRKEGVEGQEKGLSWALGQLTSTCVLYDLPLTFMSFPQLALDEDYCYNKLKDIFKLKRKKFSQVFRKLADPQMINY